MAVLKIGSKTFDYTLFRAAKEILYIPLSYEEKTAGKSVVDMFTYRLAKGSASLLLMGLIALELQDYIPLVSIAFLACWLILVVIVAKRFRELVSRDDELKTGFF